MMANELVFPKVSPIHGLGLFVNCDVAAFVQVTKVSKQQIKTEYNVHRYVNHSVTPNCKLSLNQYHLSLETLRKIQTGEELLVDYGNLQQRPR